METLETQQTLQSSLTKDCCHILEAIRRLREGTWHLIHEDSDWADFLLPIIKEALQDHIDYEELCVFPNLSENLVEKHAAEHEKMTTLLWALDESKQNKDSQKFHTFLDLLVGVLEVHHQMFDCHLLSGSHCEGECLSARIIKRARGSSLEKL